MPFAAFHSRKNLLHVSADVTYNMLTDTYNLRWAWQNPNMTRHIDASSRIAQSRITTRISPKTGKTRKRAKRPRQSLSGHLANLHLLLRSNSFQRWPLRLTFYAEDVHRVWQKLIKQSVEKLRSDMLVGVDDLPRDATKITAASIPTIPPENLAIQALDVGYDSLKPRIQKSQSIIENGQDCKCVVCQRPTPLNGAATLICAHDDCKAIYHVQCLSAKFLQEEEGTNPQTMIPHSGHCPKCKNSLVWIDLVKELTLRMRGEKEIKALFRPKRARKNATAATTEAESAHSSADEEDDEPLDSGLEEEDDEWHDLRYSSDEDSQAKRLRRDPSPVHTRKRPKEPVVTPTHSEPVIQDSDWEGAEILT